MNALPDRMQIIDIVPGKEDGRLELAERPLPTLKAGEVLIEVAAAGLNRADIAQRQGRYPVPPGAPLWPGMECSGRIVALAPGARDVDNPLAIGEEVCALVQGGGYSQYCAAPAATTLRRPRNVSLVDAAALPEAAFTVYSNLYEFAQLQAGESVLIHGGSSGIGTFAIQLAKARGSIVLATAGTAEKCALCVRLGAQVAINYRDEDFVTIARAVSGTGVDVILDMVGGSYAQRNLTALAEQGRIVVIATPGGAEATLNLTHLMRKRAVLTGSTLRPRNLEFKERMKAKLLEHVWPLLEAGTIVPVIDRVFPLREAAAAHAYMEGGTHQGKILLTP